MNECFFEIAFEAELNTKEDPELLAIAPEQCGEDPATRATAITQLRKMIFGKIFVQALFSVFYLLTLCLLLLSGFDRLFERGECRPHRTDDAFLLRYLRARDFIVPRAHKLLVRYYSFLEENQHLYKGVDLWGLMKVKDVYEGIMFDRPDIGRVSIFRFGIWDPNEFSVEDLIRGAWAVAEIGVRQPKLQILGVTVIIDMQGLTLRHVSTLTPTVAYQIVALLGVAFPVRLKSCHIVNYSWVLNTFFYIFKKFIPQSAWDKIFFHGSDLTSLHQQIDPECLPIRYGGTCRNHATFRKWLQKIKKYRDEQFDKEMKELGYVIKE